MGYITYIPSFAAIGVGIALIFKSGNNGAPIIDQYQRNNGHELVKVGVGGCLVGLALVVGGSIYDSNHKPKSRLGVVIPNSNQLGIAYNF